MAAAPRAQPATEPGAACVSCLILHVSADAAASMAFPDGALEGLTVVIDAAEPAAATALDRLAAAGAAPGLVSPPEAEVPAEVLSRATTLVITRLSDDETSVFGLRKLATAARGARSNVRVLVAGDVPAGARAYVDGRVESGSTMTRPAAGALVELSRQGEGEPVLVAVHEVDWQAVADFASQRALGTEVVAQGALTADQIVARHQAQRRRQDELVLRTIARGTTALLFEVPGFVAPVSVTAQTTIYRQPGATEMEQRDIRVNGAAVAGGSASSPPQLPLIEAERVATPPLVIALTDEYVYSLDGRTQLGHTNAYVLRFDPRRGGLRVSGRAWIDSTTFALLRLETVQGGLQGAIVSSEQHDVFGPFKLGPDTVWLPTRVRVYQMYEGAGHRTPIHRTIDTPEYDINPGDFQERLQAAYASPHLMLRETPQGFRYLLRDPDLAEGGGRTIAPRAGERIRTAVLGLLVDANITVPLPFAGLSYVDLNFLNTGAQLNAFFGGSYGQLSWSVPSVGRTRWQAHGRAFAIAARYNDRSFRRGIEQYRENITQRPAHLSAGLVRPLPLRLRARLDYELDYTAFERADTTAQTFSVPEDAIVHGFVGAIEGESGPWTLRAWWNPARRQRWSAWGELPDARDEADAEDARTFQRFAITAARTLALSRAVASRVEVAWMGGHDLDRFSRYSFGAFENRLRGYPTASIRYDHGGVLRSATSWAGRGFRIDGFGDIAAVRDPGLGEGLRAYPGAGAAVEVGGPFRTLWSVEWGYGFRARRSDGRLGTQAVRITAYRTF